MRHWWERERFGLLVQASLAAVPAWSPIGESATWYRSQIGDDVSNTLLHQSPLAETLQYHAEHWPHIDHYDDFIDELTFDAFDADSWVRVATDAGMGYLVMTAKHYDGWCWWDAPNTERTVLHHGPRRNVLAQVAASCAEQGVRFGAAYSLLDWGDPRHPTKAYVDEVVHPQLVDLVRRYGADLIRGGGHWGASDGFWRSDELTAKLRSLNPDLMLNDRFWASQPGVQTVDFLTPWFQSDREWELYRSLGTGNGFNRAEPVDRLLTPRQIVATLTEVVARGGHLLVSIGPDARGEFPAEQVRRLKEAGEWVRRHHGVLSSATPWVEWGDDTLRYLRNDRQIVAIDTDTHRGTRARFPHVTKQRAVVSAVSDGAGNPLDFAQDDAGLTVWRDGDKNVGTELAEVYYLDTEPVHALPISLFPYDESTSADLALTLSQARPGDVVQLGEGVYHGPATIPAGVTVRGLGSHRTTVAGGEEAAVVLESGSRLEHCRVTGGRRIAWLPKTCAIVAGNGASLLACRISGHVHIESADSVKVSSCHLSGVVVVDSHHIAIVRSNFTGMGWDCAIDLDGGEGHLIDSNDFSSALQAVRVRGTTGTTVRNNTISARWWGVQLIDATATRVVANRIERTMRAVDVDGGVDNEVSGNAVFDGDSGCVIQRGAASTDVAGNHWTRLRVGLFVWDAGPYRSVDNTTVDIAQAIHLVGPDVGAQRADI